MTRDVFPQLQAAGYVDLLTPDYTLLPAPPKQRLIGFATPEFLTRLRHDTRFKNGDFYGLHRDVGENLQDYRSHTGVLGPGSVQIVIDTTTLAVYADTDKFSPYSDLVGIFGHVFGELLPNWFRKRKRQARPLSAMGAGPSIFGPDQLAKIVREAVPTLPEGHTSAVVAGVTQEGVRVVAQIKLQEHWQITAAATHSWTGETTVGAQVLLSW